MSGQVGFGGFAWRTDGLVTLNAMHNQGLPDLISGSHRQPVPEPV